MSVSHEWMQTELMLVANAPQQFTVEVWQVILTRNDKADQQAMYQTIQTTHINDALAFLQMADLQRNQEKTTNQGRLYPSSPPSGC